MATRILQISDFHLFENPEDCFEGIPIYKCFVETIDFIRNNLGNFDYIIMTGDLAHTGSTVAYRQIKELMGDFYPRCRLIPGNHDCRENLRSIFDRIIPNDSGSVNFSFSVENWQLIGLDSLLLGHVEGEIGIEQFEWLESELFNCDTQNIVVFVHHPPVAVGSPWLDKIGLIDSRQLGDILDKFRNIKVIFAGHAHQEYYGQLGSIPVFGIPSTSFQFTPKTNIPAYDPLPPGVRIIELDGDDFRQSIVRNVNSNWVLQKVPG